MTGWGGGHNELEGDSRTSTRHPQNWHKALGFFPQDRLRGDNVKKVNHRGGGVSQRLPELSNGCFVDCDYVE